MNWMFPAAEPATTGEQPASGLRIGIDGYNLALPRGTGVTTYAFTLANTLQRMGAQVEGVYGLKTGFRRDVRETRFFEALANEHRSRRPTILGWRLWAELAAVGTGARAAPIDITPWVIKDAFATRLPSFSRILNAQDLFERAMRHFRRYRRFLALYVPNPPDVMHWTYPLPIRMVGARNIYTLHDLVPLRLPYASLENKLEYKRLVSACVQQADHICTVSESSRNDILDMLGGDPARVTNTFQAVHIKPELIGEPEQIVADTVKGVFNLPYKEYFLFFGAIEPKKNVGRLIEAYLSLATDTPLVIVGAAAWQSEQELRLLRRDETQPLRATFRRIRRLDYLPRSLLIRLIRGAKAVAFPSLYEGFGLPVLESMLLGTPVLTSRNSSLAEVAGDGAIYVDPYSPASISEGLRALDRDAALRERLSLAGRASALRFNNGAYADRLWSMYRTLL
jgi:glycosyltransferase involved in cell wall biosynthesis